MTEHDIAVLDKILDFLGFTIAIDNDNDNAWPYKVFLSSKRQAASQSLGKSNCQTPDNRVYFFLEDKACYAHMFMSYDEVLHGIFNASTFTVPRLYDEYGDPVTKVLKNPFYMLTKEEAAIKIDLESYT